MDVRIAVASATLGSGFTGTMYALIRKCLQPGESTVECATIMQGDTDFARGRLLSLVEGHPKPRALIGICIQPAPSVVTAFRAAGVPIVLVDELAEGASTVASDNFAGGYLAGQHLASLGRKQVALVAGKMHVEGGYNALQRAKGLHKALAEKGLPFSLDEVIEAPDYTRKDGLAAMTRILGERAGTDAVFCAAGDACATGLLARARERLVKIPDQIAIVGYDDNPLASISDPPLTTVRQPLEQIAREAHRLATVSAAEILERPTTTLFEPRLVVRQSA
ncbi:MAG TPA: substrate-binding domain-containing protein [Anaeromyxobacter sp.]|nr:substrate-binding domain-containing protein [Anaeromyxobacter sp.]